MKILSWQKVHNYEQVSSQKSNLKLNYSKAKIVQNNKIVNCLNVETKSLATMSVSYCASDR